jgi:hypothetical protein
VSRRLTHLLAGLNLRKLPRARFLRWCAAAALWTALVVVPDLKADETITDASASSATEAATVEPGETANEHQAKRGFFPGLDLWAIPNLSGRGPLYFRDPFALSLLHLQLPTNTLKVMEEGDGDISAKLQWANSFVTDEEETLQPFVVDAETLRLEVGGFKWEVVDDIDLEFNIIENIAPFDSSADIVGHLGLNFSL